MTDVVAGSGRAPASARRAVAVTALGNALEVYDFTIFALFAIQIGQVFFPSQDSYASLMASFATFGAGFISRPLGAWVIGGFADRHGRRPALILSMVLMGVGILGIALTPGYAAIGYAAPVIVVIARLIQGFAFGGEIGPATAYMLENAGTGRRGLVVSLQRGSQLVAGAVGALIGLLLSVILTPPQFDAYGWRLALLAGASIVPFALYARRNLPETLDQPEERAETGVLTNSVARALVIGFLYLTYGTISAYVLTYLTTFAQASLKLPSGAAMAGQMLGNLAGLIACMAGGHVSDIVGRKPACLVPLVAGLVILPLAFAWLVAHPTGIAFVLVAMLFAAFTNFTAAPAITAVTESLPKPARARLFAIVYATPVAIFGGTTQLVVTWLIHVTGSNMSMIWYNSGAMVIALCAIAMLAETAPGLRRRLAIPA